MHRSEAQVKADYLAKMGPDLGELYFALYKELTWLHARWLEYRKLFAEPENIPLLNRNGSFIFRKLLSKTLG